MKKLKDVKKGDEVWIIEEYSRVIKKGIAVADYEDNHILKVKIEKRSMYHNNREIFMSENKAKQFLVKKELESLDNRKSITENSINKYKHQIESLSESIKNDEGTLKNVVLSMIEKQKYLELLEKEE